MSVRVTIEGPIRTPRGNFAVVVEQERWVGERYATTQRSPAAVVFLEPEGPRAVDLRGEPVDLDALAQELPELRAWLRELGSG